MRSDVELLLLFRHSAKSLNAQDERLVTSPYLVTRLHLPHAIEVRLHMRKSNVVILTPETAVKIPPKLNYEKTKKISFKIL